MKRFGMLALALVLILAFQAVSALAETPDMEAVNVAWDLEVNKPVTCLGKFTGTDADFPLEYSITNMKDTVTADGMRQISFTLTYNAMYSPGKDEVTAIADANVDGNIGGTFAWTLVDYDTGLNIEDVNSIGLTEQVDEKTYNEKKFNGNGGAYISCPARAVYQITITFPKDYDGLCIGVLGQSAAIASDTDMAFWEGKVPFSQTSYYSPDNDQVSHFMRIRAVPEE